MSDEIIINGLKVCDTCRKAVKALEAAGQPVRLRDLREDAPSEAEVKTWLDALGDGLLNTRSTTWRGLDEAARAKDPVALMVANPTLIKRPVIGANGKLLLGWTAASQAALGL